jgi:hypothetical protein
LSQGDENPFRHLSVFATIFLIRSRAQASHFREMRSARHFALGQGDGIRLALMSKKDHLIWSWSSWTWRVSTPATPDVEKGGRLSQRRWNAPSCMNIEAGDTSNSIHQVITEE